MPTLSGFSNYKEEFFQLKRKERFLVSQKVKSAKVYIGRVICDVTKVNEHGVKIIV
jgi:hypothetical protein